MRISTITLIAMIGFGVNASAQTNAKDTIPVKMNKSSRKKVENKKSDTTDNNIKPTDDPDF